MTKPERIRTCPDPEGWARRLLAHSQETDSGCIEWTGKIGTRPRHRYGRFSATIDGKNSMTGAHRAAWLVWRGDIPGDLVIDHLCRNTICINVAHMELVTNQENGKRGDHTGMKGRGGTGSRGKRGCGKHGYTDGYVWQTKDGYLRWMCRICRRASQSNARRKPPQPPGVDG